MLTRTNKNVFFMHFYNSISTSEVTILVDSAKDKAEVELIMSYVVYSASWIPKYDIRVFNSDKKMTVSVDLTLKRV